MTRKGEPIWLLFMTMSLVFRVDALIKVRRLGDVVEVHFASRSDFIQSTFPVLKLNQDGTVVQSFCREGIELKGLQLSQAIVNGTTRNLTNKYLAGTLNFVTAKMKWTSGPLVLILKTIVAPIIIDHGNETTILYAENGPKTLGLTFDFDPMTKRLMFKRFGVSWLWAQEPDKLSRRVLISLNGSYFPSGENLRLLKKILRDKLSSADRPLKLVFAEQALAINAHDEGSRCAQVLCGIADRKSDPADTDLERHYFVRDVIFLLKALQNMFSHRNQNYDGLVANTVMQVLKKRFSSQTDKVRLESLDYIPSLVHYWNVYQYMNRMCTNIRRAQHVDEEQHHLYYTILPLLREKEYNQYSPVAKMVWFCAWYEKFGQYVERYRSTDETFENFVYDFYKDASGHYDAPEDPNQSDDNIVPYDEPLNELEPQPG